MTKESFRKTSQFAVTIVPGIIKLLKSLGDEGITFNSLTRPWVNLDTVKQRQVAKLRFHDGCIEAQFTDDPYYWALVGFEPKDKLKLDAKSLAQLILFQDDKYFKE